MPSSLASAVELRPGERLDDRYEILRPLGEGGMGRVYVARQLTASRDVAVKVIHEQRLHDPRSIRRFIEEARAACAMRHPNVVTVHDFGRTSGGMLYLVMELIEGVGLDGLLRTGPLAPRRALAIAAQVCAGLQEAHRHAIVHRDLKPDNVMICHSEGIGELAKIVDFGVAETIGRPGAERARDATLRVAGSPAYMSPEQATGAPVDSRSDLYSLGVVIYEMLAGRLPFEADDPATLLRLQVDSAPPPLELPEAFVGGTELAQLVARCLAKRPDERPRSASVLREALQRIAAAVPEGAGGAAGEPARPPESHRATTVTSTGPSLPGHAGRWSAIEWRAGEIACGRYRLLAIGRGTTETVAEAEDLLAPLGARATIRRLPFGDPGVRASVELVLERWTSLLVHFRHPRIEAILDCEWEGEALVVVTERRAGPTLRARLHDGGAMEPAQAARIARDLCDGLERLHELGLLHHRLRPESVRLGEDGAAVLGGVIQGALFEAGVIADAVDVVPDACYRAPEQLGGLDAAPGPATDLYALGAMLHEMLTGEAPWREVDDARRIEAKLGGPPGRSERARLPLERVVARLLAASPTDRYPSAAALRGELDAMIDGGAAAGESALVRVDAEGRLHGRDAERARLAGLLAEAQAGRGALAWVRGPAGIGKTRLLDELAAEARRTGGVVLRAHGRPGPRPVPFAVARRLFAALSSWLAAGGAEERRALLERTREAAGPLGAVARSFAPYLATLFAGAPAPPVLDADAERTRLLRVLGTVLTAPAAPGRPLCLLVDDVQWVDEGTRALLAHLGETARRGHVLVVAAARSADGDAAEPAADGAPGAGALLELEPLSAAQTAAFVEERLGEVRDLRALVEALHRLSGGNPQALRGVLAEAEEVGAVALRSGRWHVDLSRLARLAPADDVVERMTERLRGLSPEAIEVLGAAAVWGRSVQPASLERLLDARERGQVVGALAAADRAGVIRARRLPDERIARWDFSHDALREAALRALPADQVRRLHRRAAELLAETAVPEATAPERAQEVAAHLLGADPRSEDAAWLERAARAALASLDGEGAVRFGRAARARVAPDAASDARRLELDLLVARGLARIGDVGAATDALDDLLRRAGGEALRGEIRHELAHLQHVTGKLSEAVSTLDATLSDLGAPPRRGWRASVALRWRFLVEIMARPRFVPRADGRRGAPDERHRRIAGLMRKKAEVTFFIDPPGGLGATLDGLHHARRSGDPGAYAEALAGCAVVVAVGVGSPDLGAKLARTALEMARGCSLAERTIVHVFALKAFYVGRFEDDQARIEKETVELVRRLGDPWLEGLLETYRAERDFEFGRLDSYVGAAIRLGELLGSDQQRRWFKKWSRGYCALAALHSGQPELARLATEGVLDEELAAPDALVQGVLVGAKVNADALCGRHDDALRAAERLLDLTGSTSPRGWYAAASLCSAAAGLCLTAVARDDDERVMPLLTAIVKRGTPVVRPYRLHRLHLMTSRARLERLRGNHGASRRAIGRVVRGLAAEAGPNFIVAQLGRDAALLEGGRETREGRRLLRLALAAASTLDDRLPLRRDLLAACGEEVPEVADDARVWTDVARALNLDPVRAAAAIATVSADVRRTSPVGDPGGRTRARARSGRSSEPPE